MLAEARGWQRARQPARALRLVDEVVDGWQERAVNDGVPSSPLALALDVRAGLLDRLGNHREARADADRAARIRALHTGPASRSGEE
ncbi:hypothetical protein Daura_31710 [Dactylosporangium aurantiacum]|uniref:Uncharacterized protein n=1 Tax=Dactylosporangium aurantiacum TaxID=35754 RepID=A0A9Q9MED6_9ACTN|nr:hypothetical protein [Dactylosporangium aurantiacum]MDG6109534.1 hypothetical protein [Dactylosporangium aurantiacum]UWZ51310.1 hypothetical protein Daura_31710 [Dactylosporangium aurantiacum]